MFILLLIGLGLVGYGGYDVFNAYAHPAVAASNTYFGFGVLLMVMGAVIIWLVLHTPRG